MLNSFQHLTASLYLPPSLGEILKQVQDDFGRFLLFLHSFWGSQFNTSVKRSLLSKKFTALQKKSYFGVPPKVLPLTSSSSSLQGIKCQSFSALVSFVGSENPQASLVFRSLNRTFAYNETLFADYTTPFGCHFHRLHGTWRL